MAKAPRKGRKAAATPAPVAPATQPAPVAPPAVPAPGTWRRQPPALAATPANPAPAQPVATVAAPASNPAPVAPGVAMVAPHIYCPGGVGTAGHAVYSALLALYPTPATAKQVLATAHGLGLALTASRCNAYCSHWAKGRSGQVACTLLVQPRAGFFVLPPGLPVNSPTPGASMAQPWAHVPGGNPAAPTASPA